MSNRLKNEGVFFCRVANSFLSKTSKCLLRVGGGGGGVVCPPSVSTKKNSASFQPSVHAKKNPVIHCTAGNTYTCGSILRIYMTIIGFFPVPSFFFFSGGNRARVYVCSSCVCVRCHPIRWMQV